jgi:hypothetical protein
MRIFTEEQRQKHKQRCKDYYEKNKEKLIQQARINRNKPENKEKSKQKRKEYYLRVKDTVYSEEKRKKYYNENKDHILENKIEYYERNKEIIKENRINYYKNNPHKRQERRNKENAKRKEKYHSDSGYKLKRLLDSSIRKMLKFNGLKKSERTIELIGCSEEEFKKHIESQFTDGMAWENYGKGSGKWNIDHIIPCVSFDLTKLEERLKCFNYKNQRPLWERENLSKNDKMPDGSLGRMWKNREKPDLDDII